MGRRLSNKVSVVLRTAIGLTLIGGLLWTIGPASLVEGLSDLVFSYLALAVLAQVAAKVVWALRWQEILRVSGIDKGLVELLVVLHIGFFFNNFLPSSMGGDVVRGYYSAAGRENLAAAYGVVIAERLIGFAALALMCAIAILVVLLNGTSQFPSTLLLSALIGCVAILLGGAVLFFSNLWSFVVNVFARFPKAHQLATELGRAMQFTKKPGSRTYRVAALSMLLQIIGVLFYVASARAVGISLSTVSFFFVVPVAVLASMVPISLNGLGLREGALVGLMQGFGVAVGASGAFAILARLIDFAFALLGGILFVFAGAPVKRMVKT